ncbi:uncharacterized protein LOC134697677 [Mytilus trossulus]|uniref:uncharacterized protein LOC134697677 n=1 Tax=Mytilus trossulus TaxID=6551 RepID=UPI003004AF80
MCGANTLPYETVIFDVKNKNNFSISEESNLVTMLYFVIVSLIMVVYVDSEECTRKVTELKRSERKLRNDMVHLQNVFLERLSRTDKSNSEYKNSKAFVGFSAYLSEGFASGHSKSLSQGKSLIFDQTETNTAGVYNTKTGIFKAPSSGMYAFTWTLCVDSRINHGGIGEFGTELVVDGKACGKLHADTEHAGDDACSTGFVIKYVSEGRTVYLKNIYNHQGILLSKEIQTRTTFSGWKLN